MAVGHNEIAAHLSAEMSVLESSRTGINEERLQVERMVIHRDEWGDVEVAAAMATLVTTHEGRGCSEVPCPFDDWADQADSDAVEVVV